MPGSLKSLNGKSTGLQEVGERRKGEPRAVCGQCCCRCRSCFRWWGNARIDEIGTVEIARGVLNLESRLVGYGLEGSTNYA